MIAIDPYLGGLEAQTVHRTPHGQQGGLQDIELVNLLHAGLGHTEAQGLGSNFLIELLTFACRQFFGICQTFDGLLIVKDDGGRKHGPSPGAAPSLVYPCQ